MTLDPVTVDPQTPLSEAQKMMREMKVRHLPVVKDGSLVGILSLRDVHLFETFDDVDATAVPTSDAMVTPAYVVGLGEPLERVVSEMLKRKVGSAVVLDHRRIAGIFTSHDALRALRMVLRGQISARRGRPHAARGRELPNPRPPRP